MDETKEYDLSLFGDIKSKIIGIIAAIVSFATVLQSFLNCSHTILGFGFANAYRLFIVLYFVMPALYLIWLIWRHQRLMKNHIHLSKISFPGNRFFIVASLLAATAFFYLFSTETTWLLPGVAFISLFIICLFIIIVYRLFAEKKDYGQSAFPIVVKIKNRIKSLAEEDREYILIISAAVLLAVLYFGYNFRKTDRNAKQTTEVLNRYDSAYNFKDSAGTSAGHIVSDAESKLRSPAVKLAAFTILNQCKSIDSLHKIDTCDAALTAILIHIDTSVGKRNNPAIQMVESELNMRGNTLLKSLDGVLLPLKERQFNTLKIAMYKSLINCYGENAKLMALAINNRIAEDNSLFKKEWLSHLFLLQYKGLLWLFLLFIAAFTLLYYQRQELSLIRFNNALRSSLEKEGNEVKNLLYIIVLLMIPFFKNIKEEDISLDKPFINWGISNLIPDVFVPKSGTSTSAYFDTAASFRFIHVDTIKVIADTSLLHAYQDSLSEKVKYLGSKAIVNSTDRSEFIEHFDSTQHTYERK